MNLEKQSLHLLQYPFFIYKSGVNDPCLGGFLVMNKRDDMLVLGKQLFNKLVSFHAMGMMRMDALGVHTDGASERLAV